MPDAQPGINACKSYTDKSLKIVLMCMCKKYRQPREYIIFRKYYYSQRKMNFKIAAIFAISQGD